MYKLTYKEFCINEWYIEMLCSEQQNKYFNIFFDIYIETDSNVCHMRFEEEQKRADKTNKTNIVNKSKKKRNIRRRGDTFDHHQFFQTHV